MCAQGCCYRTAALLRGTAVSTFWGFEPVMSLRKNPLQKSVIIILWLSSLDTLLIVLIGAGGTRRPDWPVRVHANDVSMRIDR